MLKVSETSVLDDGTLSPFRRLDARQLGGGPDSRLYAGKDGWIALVAEGAGVFDRLGLLAGAANAEALEPILSAQSTTAVIAMANAAGAFAVAAHTDHRDAFFDDRDNRRLGIVQSYPHGRLGRSEARRVGKEGVRTC